MWSRLSDEVCTACLEQLTDVDRPVPGRRINDPKSTGLEVQQIRLRVWIRQREVVVVLIDLPDGKQRMKVVEIEMEIRIAKRHPPRGHILVIIRVRARCPQCEIDTLLWTRLLQPFGHRAHQDV